MGKKIVISFPGGRGYEIPVMYFGAKYYEDQGYEKLFICHPKYEECEYDILWDNADKIISQIDFCEYDEVVFIAKSIGTIIACRMKEKYQIPAILILLTPLSGTIPYIHSKNDVKLVTVGSKDRYIDVEMLKKICDDEKVLCHVEPDVGHRMEVLNDLDKNLSIISNVIQKLK